MIDKYLAQETDKLSQHFLDGAKTLTDAAQKLRDYAHELEHMRSSGLELAAPVEDDYGIVRPGGAPPDGVLDADEDGV